MVIHKEIIDVFIIEKAIFNNFYFNLSENIFFIFSIFGVMV